ncbi:hypothetical protein HOS55_gp067 [Pseudomonas phage PMBT3]|uniref:Uncharacterized protein n=1 Tax=Pseudomonas phage PMBT3 TaxID=2059856 RepID=A0A2I6PHY9_9CAUD|nr:hypothetical protein HOS55_gp067 [Pseudomonas phage PMBT3]AUM59669.1 hypothetical protein [Pseudomonas phage PMBT3]
MPRLTDKHIAAIRAAAEDNDQTYGFGDVILLCDELQERRKDINPTRDLAQTSATNLLQELTTCINQNEPLNDADVLALFHALQSREYFQTTCLVDRQSLKSLLYALSAPEQPHLILEMQHTRGLPRADGERLNPIDQLIVDMRRPSHASA